MKRQANITDQNITDQTADKKANYQKPELRCLRTMVGTHGKPQSFFSEGTYHGDSFGAS
jgi:hypothetical protein